MPVYPFMQVDAFTGQRLGGNPCAILFDTDNLDAETMLAIAREMNLSETSFVRRSNVADVGARYFTPAGEIPLAGHPTIATVFALAETGRIKLTGDHTTILLELPVGPIPVEIFTKEGNIQRIVMSQKKPEFLATYNPAEVLPIFGLAVDDVLPGVPLQTVSTGTPQLMIPLRELDALRRIQLNLVAYAAFRAQADFFTTHLFCLKGVTGAGQTFARDFVDPPDLIEDPFTGSATGGMGVYLWHYGLIDKPAFIAEQGHWLHRPGQATVEVIGPPNDIETVKVGGGAITVVRGEFVL
ncbi:MAG: PhzF family phenazine biosynthesis protein [Anaerolineae bacterium]|nr:PhzF family phenazine biosynthesis protein [Anaerolineae bacterium]